MARVAQIVAGTVHWITDSATAAQYPAGLGLQFVDLTAHPEVQEGWTYNGVAFNPPAVATVPQVLAPIDFIHLCQTAGGMTDAQLVAAKNDATLAALWIKFDMVRNGVERDSALTAQGLAALAATGYLPNGAAAVTAAWPTA